MTWVLLVETAARKFVPATPSVLAGQSDSASLGYCPELSVSLAALEAPLAILRLPSSMKEPREFGAQGST